MPATVPGDFTVGLGDVLSGRTYRELLEELSRLGGAASGFLTLLEFVEVEVQGFPGMLEDLRRLRGAVMAVSELLRRALAKRFKGSRTVDCWCSHNK